VADAVALAGTVAHLAHGRTTIESERSQYAAEEAQLNFRGEAEPRKLPGRPNVSGTPTDGISATPVRILIDVGHGVGHSAKAVAEMPFDIWTALALGFRNAPRLYGDATVRPPPHTITGVRSGLKAAGDELWLGFYDGITGMVRIPYLEVQRDGLVGLPMGLVRGVGGLVLKPISGVLGLGAYTLIGVRAGTRKRFRDTTKTDRWIRQARMTQGAHELLAYSKKSSASAPGAAPIHQNDDLEEVRTRCRTNWSSCEQAVAEARAKEKKLEKKHSLVLPLNRRGPGRRAGSWDEV